MAPTPESLRRAGLLIWIPAAAVGGILISVAIYYSKMLNNWSIALASLLAVILGIVIWSIAVSAKNLEFRKV